MNYPFRLLAGLITSYFLQCEAVDEAEVFGIFKNKLPVFLLHGPMAFEQLIVFFQKSYLANRRHPLRHKDIIGQQGIAIQVTADGTIIVIFCIKTVGKRAADILIGAAAGVQGDRNGVSSQLTNIAGLHILFQGRSLIRCIKGIADHGSGGCDQ